MAKEMREYKRKKAPISPVSSVLSGTNAGTAAANREPVRKNSADIRNARQTNAEQVIRRAFMAKKK